jgi:hypothetical protein
LRYRLYQVPATLAHHARSKWLTLAAHHPWARLAHHGLTRLKALAPT